MNLITRDHVLDILARAGLTPEQEQEREQAILTLPYPVEVDRVTGGLCPVRRDEGLADPSPGREPLRRVDLRPPRAQPGRAAQLRSTDRSPTPSRCLALATDHDDAESEPSPSAAEGPLNRSPAHALRRFGGAAFRRSPHPYSRLADTAGRQHPVQEGDRDEAAIAAAQRAG